MNARAAALALVLLQGFDVPGAASSLPDGSYKRGDNKAILDKRTG
jgi:hypothetical protein